MKKTLFTLLAFAAMTLVACGQPSGDNKPSGDESKGFVKEATTIKFVNTYGKNYQPKLNAWIEEFKQIEPNVTVENTVLNGNYDTIHSQTISDMGTGEYGDLVICYADHVVDYMEYGKAVNFEKFINNAEYGLTEEEFGDYIPGFVQEGQEYLVPGTYSMPFSKSSEAMFYNADVLVGLNLAAQDPTINGGQPLTTDYLDNLTWEELFDHLAPAILAKNDSLDAQHKIIKEGGDVYGVVGYDSVDNLFITIAEQYGYGYTSVNKETGEASLDFNNENMRNLAKKFNEASRLHYLVPAGEVENNSYCSSFFVDNQLLFNIGSTAGVSHEVASDFDVNVTSLPHAANGKRGNISQGPSLCILNHNNDENRQLAAWLFYKFLTTAERSAEWATTVGYLPVRTTSLTSEEYMEYTTTEGKPAKSLELLSAKNCLYSTAALRSAFSTPAFKGSSSARKQCGALMLKILLEPTANVTDAWVKTQFDTAENNIRTNMA